MRNGVTSLGTAREAYGVILNAELGIDASATEARRGEMRG